MAALTGCIQTNAQIYFDISDVLHICVHTYHMRGGKNKLRIDSEIFRIDSESLKSESENRFFLAPLLKIKCNQFLESDYIIQITCQVKSPLFI